MCHRNQNYHEDAKKTQKPVGDAICVTTPRIFRDNDLWYMVYAGSNVHEDTPWCFGVAASRDLVHWTRYPGNPVFERGNEGEWDDCGIWYGTTVKVEDTIMTDSIRYTVVGLLQDPSRTNR